MDMEEMIKAAQAAAEKIQQQMSDVQATLDSHEVEFEYKKLGSARYEARRVQSYHLGCVENQWYLIGHDLARRQLRTFALPRMRRARNTKAKFRRPSNFSIAGFLSDSFGVFTGKARTRVSIRFDEFASRLVSERRWHASQKLKTLPDGTLELTLDVGGLEEIERWVLSWGEHATVLGPPALVTRIRTIAAELQARYAK